MNIDESWEMYDSWSRLRQFAYHVRFGWGHHYPICCCIRWSYMRVVREEPQAEQRPCREKPRPGDPDNRYVVCGIFHK
jgi:hypothetical protein